MRKKAHSLFHNAVLNRHQGVVDFDKVILAILFQIQCVKLKLDDIVGVCPQLPLDEGVGGIRTVREARGLDLSFLIGPCMF